MHDSEMTRAFVHCLYDVSLDSIVASSGLIANTCLAE